MASTSEVSSVVRSRLSLSRPSILLGVAAALVCVGLIAVPDHLGLRMASAYAWHEYEYGWPWVWMRRLPPLDSSSPVLANWDDFPWEWSSFTMWTDVNKFHWQWLLLDTLSALLVGCGVAVAFEVRARRGIRWYQITIRETLVVVALAACAASYLTSQKRQWNADVEIYEQFWSEDEHFLDGEYAGPAVLKRPIRLLGCSLFDRVTAVFLSEATTDSELASLMPRLTASRHLRLLSLSDTQISDKGICGLSGLAGVEGLRLHSTDISDEALRCVLKNFPRLKSLNLGYTQIGDEGVKALGNLPDIEILYLEGTRITDQGLTTLANCKKLRELELAGTAVTPKGIAQLKRALPGCEVSH